MTSKRRLKGMELDLEAMLEAFRIRLLAALHDCADNGVWGVLGLYHGKEYAPGFGKEGRELAETAIEIGELREALGFAEPEWLSHRFLEYRKMRGSQVPNAPKLAKNFLAEIAEYDAANAPAGDETP